MHYSADQTPYFSGSIDEHWNSKMAANYTADGGYVSESMPVQTSLPYLENFSYISVPGYSIPSELTSQPISNQNYDQFKMNPLQQNNDQFELQPIINQNYAQYESTSLPINKQNDNQQHLKCDSLAESQPENSSIIKETYSEVYSNTSKRLFRDIWI